MIPDEEYKTDPETIHLRARLAKAANLLREWRIKYGGKEHHEFRSYHSPDVVATASPSDLLVATQKFLEGK